MYTDASKYGWAGVLTQLHTTVIDGKTITTDHPVAYVSGLFRGSQINWAALTKEAYAIYMSVKKLSFYLTYAEVLLKSDHLPLKKFLQKNTLNNKVNNWAMELEAFNIKFQHVSGKTNILADTLSRLVDIDPDARLDKENAGWEFGYYVFETLPKLSSEEIVPVCEILLGTNVILPDPDLQEPFTQQLTSPLTNDQLQALQAQDEKCTALIAMLRHGRLDPLVYSINDGILYRRVIEGGQTFQAIYIPRTPPGLIQSILKAAHDDQDHSQLEDTQEVHVRNPNYKGKNYDPNYQARKTETNKQQQQPTMANNQYKAPYTRPAANNNNNNLASSSDIAGEITLKTTVDGYQLLKMNKLIKNAAAWRARMPKTGRFDKYFDNKETTKPTPKVQINSATLQVMGQAAKDYGYTKDKFIEAVEMYEHFGNVNLEDVPSPSPQD